MLTFESQQTAGTAAIIEKLVVGHSPPGCCFRSISVLTLRTTVKGLPFETVQHRVTTLDAQPASQENAAMIVLVTGQLIVRRPSHTVVTYSLLMVLLRRYDRLETKRTRSTFRRLSISCRRALDTTCQSFASHTL